VDQPEIVRREQIRIVSETKTRVANRRRLEWLIFVLLVAGAVAPEAFSFILDGFRGSSEMLGAIFASSFTVVLGVVALRRAFKGGEEQVQSAEEFAKWRIQIADESARNSEQADHIARLLTRAEAAEGRLQRMLEQRRASEEFSAWIEVNKDRPDFDDIVIDKLLSTAHHDSLAFIKVAGLVGSSLSPLDQSPRIDATYTRLYRFFQCFEVSESLDRGQFEELLVLLLTAIASNPNTPYRGDPDYPCGLSDLAQDTGFRAGYGLTDINPHTLVGVRAAIARNPSLPFDSKLCQLVTSRLMGDPSEIVVASLAGNESLVRHWHLLCEGYLAKQEFIAIMAAHNSESVRAAITGNHSVDFQTIPETLKADRSDLVRGIYYRRRLLHESERKPAR